MNADSAINWLILEQFNQWRLDRNEDEKVSDFVDTESFDDALKRLQAILPLQQPGKYVLRGWKGKNRNSSESRFRFEIERLSVNNHSQKGPASYDPEKMYRDAEERAYLKLKTEQWQENVNTRLDKLEKAFEQFEELKRIVQDLHDDDEENDESAIQKLTNMAETVPKLVNGFQSMSGFLNKKSI